MVLGAVKFDSDCTCYYPLTCDYPLTCEIWDGAGSCAILQCDTGAEEIGSESNWGVKVTGAG